MERLLKDEHETGSSLGMTRDAMHSRVVNAMMTKKTLINNDCINLSSLLRRYGERCK
jgi:hypothetical protein